MNTVKFNEFDQVEEFLKSRSVLNKEIISTVSKIIADVKERKDEALVEYTKKFDCPDFESSNLVVSREEIENSARNVDQEILGSFKKAEENIFRFHQKEVREDFSLEWEEGTLSRRYLPINPIGIYIPGGTAPLVSTILMTVIPAKIAKVEEIILCTPPDKEGKINPYILAIASHLGIKKIFKAGGAQAIAAMAHGTESIPKVNKIFGPGNKYVIAAKKLLYGEVGIDSLPGPSEIAIIADENSNPEYIAADLLSQAEHGTGDEGVFLITNSENLIEKVEKELLLQLDSLERKELAKEVLEKGYTILVNNLDEAFLAVNKIAPEHLEILLPEARKYLPKVKNSGAVFLGEYSPEAVGDYYCGTNHVLPTNRTARYSSSLGVEDYLKNISIIEYSMKGLEKASPHIRNMSRIEGLIAHIKSVESRLKKK